MSDITGGAARNRAVGMAINGKGYVGTGWDGSTYFPGWWEYDPASDTWASKADFNGGTYPRNRACGFSLNGKGYVAMGQDGTQNFVGLFKYDPTLDQWSNPKSFTTARYSSVAFAIGGFGYVCGGYNGSTYFNDLWQYDPVGNTLTQKANFSGAARYSAAGFSIGIYGYVGTGYSSGGYMNDFWQYNPQSNIWTQKANFPGAPRALAVGFSIGERGYMGTGDNGNITSLSDMWEYNPITNSWIQRANFGGGSRSAAVAFSINGYGYIATGSYSADAIFQKDLWKYTPASSPSVTFQKSYGGTNDDVDTSAVAERIASGYPTSDGGYIIASSTKSFGNNFDVLLIKTNPFGDTLWTKKYGGTDNDIVSSVMQTSDGGYVIAGFTNMLTSDGFILKTNSSGLVQWNRTFVGTGIQRANFTEEIPGGNIMVTGRTDASGLNGAGLMKLNSMGVPQWSRTIGPTGATSLAEGFSIEQTSSGGFIIGGTVKSGAGTIDAYLATTTSSGLTVTTSRAIQSPFIDMRAMLKQTPDGGYIICGSTNTTSGNGGYDIFLVKADYLGAPQWGRAFGGANDDIGRSVIVTNSGEYILAGYTKSYGAGSNDAFLMKVGLSGNLLWTKTYGGTASDKANSVYQTADGGYVLFGETSSFSAGGTDVYFIKTDSLGNSGCHEANVTVALSSAALSNPSVTPTNNSFTTSVSSTTPTGTKPAVTKICTFCPFSIGISANDVGCFGDCDGDAQVTAAGGAFPYTYLWSTGDSTDFISGLCAGGYTVTVTDAGGCSATDSIYIDEPPELFVNLVQNSYTICAGSSTTIGANPSGGDSSFYSFYWFPSSDLLCDTCQNTIAFPQSDTIYYLDVIDGSGCYATDSLNIHINPKPIVNAGVDKTICTGQNTTLNATGNATNYYWNPSTGLSCTTCLSPVANPAITTAYNVIGTNAFGCADSDKVIVNVVSSPTVSISSNVSTTICSGTTIVLTAVSNGNSYSWSTGATASSITDVPSASSNYFVVVANSSGCTAADSVFATVNPSPLPAFVTTDVQCNGMCNGKSTATPTAGTSPFTYLWNTSPVQTTQTATGLCAGIDSVYVKDTNGCISGGTDTIHEPAVLDMIITPANAGCGCNGSAADSVFDGTPPYAYQWQTAPVQTTQNISGLCAGNYSVLVTDNNGCTDLHMITISQLPPVVVAVSPSVTICSGTTATIGASVNGAFANIVYFWFPVNLPGDTISVSPSANTTYTVIATDTSGFCSDTGFVFVNVIQSPTATVTPSSTICSGTSVTLTASGGGNYSWSTSSTASFIAVTPPIGTNTFSVIISSGICSDTAFTSVNVNAQPTANVTAAGSLNICSGQSVSLAASGGNSYSWSPSAGLNASNISNPVASPSSTTNYIITVSIGNCQDTAAVTVGVTQTPIANITGNDTLCTGGTTLLTGTGSGNYLWSTGATSSSIIVSPSVNTIYSLTVTATSSSAFCSDADSFTVTVISSPQINLSASSDSICAGLSSDTLIANGGTIYLWTSSPSGSYPNNDTIIVSPDGNTTYTVFVTNGNGCTGTSITTINVTPGFSQPPVSPSSASYCIGDSLLPFTASPSTNPPAGVAWVDMSGNVIGSGNTFQPPQNLPVGTYTVLAVQGTSKYCLSYPTIVTMTIHSLPLADAGNDITICPDHTAQLQATGGTTYLWNPGTYLSDSLSAITSANPDSTFSYVVLVADGNNCKDIDSITVYISMSDTCGIHIYNVISPNGDGDNDVWWIDGINLFPDNVVDIFNRWGNIVWRGKNYDNKKIVWRGQNEQNQPLPSGTYYYVIDRENENRQTGWVELIR